MALANLFRKLITLSFLAMMPVVGNADLVFAGQWRFGLTQYYFYTPAEIESWCPNVTGLTNSGGIAEHSIDDQGSPPKPRYACVSEVSGQMTGNTFNPLWTDCSQEKQYSVLTGQCVVKKMLGAPEVCGGTNPINLGTANKFQKETDYRSSIESPLVLNRYYNVSVHSGTLLLPP